MGGAGTGPLDGRTGPNPPPVSGHHVHPPTRIDAKPILEIEEDLCPKCKSVLRPDEIVCVKCGFDMRRNEVHAPKLGVEHIDPNAKPEGPPPRIEGAKPHEEFSAEGRGSVQTLLLFAGALVISAMVIAGIDAPTGRVWPTVGRVVLMLYETVLATGLGLAAVAVVARICDMKLGRPDLATARILIAFAAFQVVRSITFPGPALLVTLLMWSLAIAAYGFLVMFLYKKPRNIAMYVLATHFILYFALRGGMELSGWVQSAEREAAVAAAARPSQPPP